MDAKGVDSGRSARNPLLALGTTVGVGPRRVDEVLASVGLSEVAGRSAGSFSLGMGQRLGIAAACIPPNRDDTSSRLPASDAEAPLAE